MSNSLQDMRSIIDDAIKAVLPESAVLEALNNSAFTSRKGKGRIIVASIGKAAWRMAKAASDILGSGITGAVVTKYEHSMGNIPGLEIYEAGHPVLDENTLKDTMALLERQGRKVREVMRSGSCVHGGVE